MLLQSNSTIKGSEVVTILKNKATNNTLTDVKTGSPNKLLYVGDIGGGSTPPPPPPPPPPTASGKVTFKVVYDAWRQETRWNLWKKDGTTWSQLADYGPPATGDSIVTRQFSDGYFSFDIHDSYSDGLAAPGYFSITEFDTKKEFHRGQGFTWSYSVEFEVKNGVVTKKWAGAI